MNVIARTREEHFVASPVRSRTVTRAFENGLARGGRDCRKPARVFGRVCFHGVRFRTSLIFHQIFLAFTVGYVFTGLTIAGWVGRWMRRRNWWRRPYLVSLGSRYPPLNWGTDPSFSSLWLLSLIWFNNQVIFLLADSWYKHRSSL